MLYTIYKITNNINNKTYIGKHQTNDLDDGYMGSGKLITRAINKHGPENFTKEILHVFDNELDMNAKEKELVVIDETTYNLCPGGQGGFGYINANFSGYDKKIYKATEASVKRYYEDEVYRKAFMARARLNDMTKMREGARLYFINNGGGFKGRKHTEEKKKNHSIYMKGRFVGEKSSQFGTCWITNESHNKKIKKEEFDKYVLLGYRKGRVNVR